MIRLRHPSKHYILYLLSRRLGASAAVATMQERGVAVPADSSEYDRFVKEIQGVQKRMVFPAGFHPLKKDHLPSQQYLEQLGIRDLWNQDTATMAAYHCFGEPQVCRMLQMMLLGPLNYLAISRRVRAKFDYPSDVMNPQVVRAFAHYFWKYELLNTSEWDHVLRDWIPGDSWDLRLALRAPRSSVGAAMVLYVMDQSGSESLKEVLAWRFGRDAHFMEIVKSTIGMHTGMKKAQGMLAHTQGMVLCQEQLDMRRGGSAELLEELRRIEATYDPGQLTTVHDLPLAQLPPGVVLDAEHEIAES